MKVDLNKFNRSCLSNEQKEALVLLSNLSILISDWITAKCKFLGKPGKLSTSIILGDLIIESEFLTHPLSHPMLGNRNSNNITKIEVDSTWSGKVLEYEGNSYKAYRDWTHFASDYSDRLCFTDKYDDMLVQEDIGKQLELFSSFKKNPKCYNGKVEALIDFYYLGELDEWMQKN